MRTTAVFVFIFLLLIGQTISHPITAQSSDFLEGVVSDAITSEPVAFVQIKLKINRLTIYSNSEGTFWIPKNSAFLSDSIIATAIGFKKYSITFGDLNDRKVKNIRLTPSNASVIIRVSSSDEKLNSIAILRKSIGNLVNRYPVKPFSYISYYRDYQKKDSSYINLNEAIIQTIDNGFLCSPDSNIYRIIDFRKNTSFTRLNLIPANPDARLKNLISFGKLIPESVYNGPDRNDFLTLAEQDPIRNFSTIFLAFIGFFSENFIENHNFSPPSEVFNDKLRLFKIAFNGKTALTGDSLLVSGSLYIQPDNYSIHKLDYSCYSNTKGKRLKKLFGLNVEYGRENSGDSILHLKYISVSRLHSVFDESDRSYFRLLSSTWNTITNLNPTIALQFNNRVDKSTAVQKDNFLVMIGKREIKIKNVQVVGENIYLRFTKEVVKDLKDSCEIYVRFLKDEHGNILGIRSPLEIYQYGEMFVQEYSNTVSLQDSSVTNVLSRDRDTIPFLKRKERYWMNTPEVR